MKLHSLPCFIVANGPSLNNFWREEIRSHFTIGVNRSFLKLESSILFWQDSSINSDLKNKEIINSSRSIKVSTEKCSTNTKLDVVVEVASSQFKLSTNPYEYYGTINSGVTAFCMAQVLGFSPIILLGMDAKYYGNDTNFYGVNKFHTQGIITKGRVLENFQVAMEFLKNAEDKINNKIISCSDNNFFESQDIDITLEKIRDSKKPTEEIKKEVLKEFLRMKPGHLLRR